MDELAGKVAVVTGAASGIGLAMAECFGAQGMRVAIADVEHDALARAEARLRSAGREVLAVVTDVSDRVSVQALADRTRATFGPWHLVCNNAGVQRRGMLSWEAPAELWDWVLGVNLMGVINGVSVFLPDMVERDDGHMVNTASIGSFFAGRGVGPYTVSKYGVLGLSETLFQELGSIGSAVKVSALCPGHVLTEISTAERNWPARLGQPSTRTVRGEEMNAQADAHKAREGIEPAEVAQLVVDAVRDERFWIFTDSKYDDVLRTRYVAAAERRDPTLGGST